MFHLRPDEDACGRNSVACVVTYPFRLRSTSLHIDLEAVTMSTYCIYIYIRAVLCSPLLHIMVNPNSGAGQRKSESSAGEVTVRLVPRGHRGGCSDTGFIAEGAPLEAAGMVVWRGDGAASWVGKEAALRHTLL